MQVKIIFILLGYPLLVVAISSCSSFDTSEICDKNAGCAWFGHDDEAYCDETAWISHLNKAIYSSIMFSCGPFLCFYGRRVFKFTMFVVGFTLFGLMTVDFYDSYNNTVTDGEVMFLSFVIGIVGGRFLLVLTKPSVAFFGMISGMIFAQGIWLLVEPTLADNEVDEHMETVHGVVYFSFTLVGGLLSYKLVDKSLKYMCALVGAFFIVSGGVFFWGEINSVEVWFSPERFLWDPDRPDFECMIFCNVCYVAWFLIFVSGVVFQHRGADLCKKDRNVSEKQKTRRARASERVRSRKAPRAIINGRPVNLKITLKRRLSAQSRENILVNEEE